MVSQDRDPWVIPNVAQSPKVPSRLRLMVDRKEKVVIVDCERDRHDVRQAVGISRREPRNTGLSETLARFFQTKLHGGSVAVVPADRVLRVSLLHQGPFGPGVGWGSAPVGASGCVVFLNQSPAGWGGVAVGGSGCSGVCTQRLRGLGVVALAGRRVFSRGRLPRVGGVRPLRGVECWARAFACLRRWASMAPSATATDHTTGRPMPATGLPGPPARLLSSPRRPAARGPAPQTRTG